MWLFGRRASIAGHFHAENDSLLALHALIGDEVTKARREAWEQGWVARGNQYGSDDNPYGPQEN